MGNTVSNVDVSVKIEGNDGVAIAGTTMHGTVSVKCKCDVEMKGQLVLTVIGKEKTSIRKNDTNFDSKTSFFKSSLELDTVDHATNRGRYLLPFSINLPKSLPSSTRYPDTKSHESFEVEYKIYVGLSSEKDRYSKSLNVQSQPLPDERVTYMLKPTTHDLKASPLKFRTGGALIFAASVVDTHIGRGENVEVRLASENMSDVDITRVGVKLVETVHWKATNDALVSKYSTTERTCEKELVAVSNLNLPKLCKKKNTDTELRKSLLSNDPSLHDLEEKSDCYDHIYERLLDGVNKFKLQIPKKSKDSYKGKLGRITHNLVIKVYTPTLVSNPTVVIPLQIGYPPIRKIRRSRLSAHASRGKDNRHKIPEHEVPILKTEDDDIISNRESSILATDDSEMFGHSSASKVWSRVKQGEGHMGHTIVGDLAPDDDNDVFYSLRNTKESESKTIDRFKYAGMEPSLENLLQEMKESIKDHDIIQEKLGIPAWKKLIEMEITSDDFGKVISYVDIESDQPRVAALLASNTKNFTCSYCVSAVLNSAEWVRMSMVQTLLPHCTDIVENADSIRKILSTWEWITTSRNFKSCIDHRKETEIS